MLEGGQRLAVVVEPGEHVLLVVGDELLDDRLVAVLLADRLGVRFGPRLEVFDRFDDG